MNILPLLFSGAPAQAQDMINSIGEEVTIEVGGGWARAFPRDDGSWHFLYAAGRGYMHSELDADLNVDTAPPRELTGYDTLVDHAITRCADGTWLHVASASLDDNDDSAYVFQYDNNFNRIGAAVVEERVYERKHNDPVVACTQELKVVGFTNRDIRGGEIFVLNDDLSVDYHKPLDQSPTLSGCSFVRDTDTGGLILAGFQLGSRDTALYINHYDQDLNLTASKELELTPQGQRCYWSQGFMRVNDHYLISSMCRDDDAGWAADTGDVWLQILDQDFDFVEQHQITQNELPEGGMRPYLTRRESTVMMSYDRAVRPQLHLIELNRARFGLEGDPVDTQIEVGDDTGGGNADDSGGDGGGIKGIPPERSCGCAGAPAGTPAAFWLLAGAAVMLRRRAD